MQAKNSIVEKKYAYLILDDLPPIFGRPAFAEAATRRQAEVAPTQFK